jgi:hypothetical protein
MTALESLLPRLIDYAGLFPPAGLGMDTAVRNYDSYRNGQHNGLLGRFIVPAKRLAEYEDAVRNAGVDGSAWSLSVLASTGEAELLARFNTGADESGRGGCGSIDVLEVKAASAREIQDAAKAFGGKYQLYFETPLERSATLLPAIAVARGRAKIRTGGEVPSAIPEESRVLEFLRIASERRLPFKATAGLHHALRGPQRLTYKPDSKMAVMHGFLNVFCAAALLWHHQDQRQEAAWMLAERDSDAITMGDGTMTWLNSGVTLTAEQMRIAHERFCIAFGSCSFTEPVEELEAQGWL